MDIKVIRTESEYEAVLAAIDRIFDAQPGTVDGDRLDALVSLVEAYEQEDDQALKS